MGAKRPSGKMRAEEQLVLEWRRYAERRCGSAERVAGGSCYLQARPCPFKPRPDFETRFLKDCVHCERLQSGVEQVMPTAGASGVAPTLPLLIRLIEADASPRIEGQEADEETRYRAAAFLFRALPLLHASAEPRRVARLLLAALAGAFPDSVDSLLYFRVASDAAVLTLDAALRVTDRARPHATPDGLLDLDALERDGGFDGTVFDGLREVPLPLDQDQDLLADAVFDGRTSVVPSAPRELRIPSRLAEHLPEGPIAVIPVFGRERVHGVLVVSGALGVAGWTSDQLELLSAMAAQAGSALDGSTLLGSARRRGSALAALLDLCRATAPPDSAEMRAEAVLRALVPSTGARGGAAWVRAEGEALTLAHALGMENEEALSLAGVATTLVEWFEADPKPIRAESVGADPRFAGGAPEAWSAALALPLQEDARVAGVVLLFHADAPAAPGPDRFEPEDGQTAELVARVLSLVSSRTGRAEDLRLAARRIQELEAQLRHSEKLAVVGERGVQIAQDIRNPVAAITGFARRVLKSLAAKDENREYVEIILRETERLERILTEQVALALLTRPRLKLEHVNALVQDVLQAQSEELVRRRVRLLKRLAPDVPQLLLDHDKMRHVLTNIVTYALQAVPSGGRVRVETRASVGSVQIEVAHDGPKVPGEALDRLFVPFSNSRRYGAGVGLAASYQIVREHGGEIRARSEGDWTSIVTVYLPVRENEDRRNRPDRRGGRSDRRRRLA